MSASVMRTGSAEHGRNKIWMKLYNLEESYEQQKAIRSKE